MAEKKRKIKIKTRTSYYGERMTPRTINMPDEMYDRLGDEAVARNLRGGQSDMARKIIEWFFNALDEQKGEMPQDDKVFSNSKVLANTE